MTKAYSLEEKLKRGISGYKNEEIEEQEDEFISYFDYNTLQIEASDIEILKQFEHKMHIHVQEAKKVHDRTIIETGKILFEAQSKLSKYGDNAEGTFMKWYKGIGLDKDKVSRLLKRYRLFLENPQKKEYIAAIPVSIVAELTNQDFPQEAKEEALEREVANVKELTSLAEKYDPEYLEKKKEKKTKEPKSGQNEKEKAGDQEGAKEKYKEDYDIIDILMNYISGDMAEEVLKKIKNKYIMKLK